MVPYKKIICPVDFSDASYEALKTAVDLAVHFKSELIVVHAVMPLDAVYGLAGRLPGIDSNIKEEDFIRDAEKRMNEEIPQHIPDTLSPRLKVLHGVAAPAIAELAKKEDADLIVIGTHGMTGPRHYVFGSVAEKVVQESDRNVLLVHFKGGTDR